MSTKLNPLWEVAMDVTASLSAAISLLSRSSKKGAPSNKMFDQSLKDYQATLNRARTILSQPGVSTTVTCSVKPMKLSSGETDYYVSVETGGREITPHAYRIKGRADYDVAHWNWFFHGGEEPDILAFDTDPPVIIPNTVQALKPCPFCGANASSHSSDHGSWVIECSADCAAHVWVPGRTAEECKTFWNSRVTPSTAESTKVAAWGCAVMGRICEVTTNKNTVKRWRDRGLMVLPLVVADTADETRKDDDG